MPSTSSITATNCCSPTSKFLFYWHQSTRRRTLVVLRFILIGSKDLDGGETPDAILAAQGLVLVCVDGADLDDTLRGIRGKKRQESFKHSETEERITKVCGVTGRAALIIKLNQPLNRDRYLF